MDAGTRAMQGAMQEQLPVAFHLLLHSYQLNQPKGQPTKTSVRLYCKH